MEKWSPFLLVNLILVYLIIFRNIYTIPIIIIGLFNFLYFPLSKRMKFDRFSFSVGKEGLSINFDEVAEIFENQLDEIDFKSIGILIGKEELKHELSKAKTWGDIIEIVSQLTYSYTMEAVAKKQGKAKIKEFSFRTRQIAPVLDEMFKES